MRRFTGFMVVLLLAGLLAACGTGLGTPMPARTVPGTPKVVPWTGRPAAENPGEPVSPRYQTGARPCRPADLAVSYGQITESGGVARMVVRFTNRSATACWLNGTPAVQGVSAGGAVSPVTVAAGGPPLDGSPSANIAPGQYAVTYLSAPDGCDALIGGQHRIFGELLFGLPGGGAVAAHGTGFDTICGVAVSRFGVPAYLPEPPVPWPLTARITTGAAARAGVMLGYLVTLANPTGRAFPLSPCPSYAEYLGGGPRKGGHVVRYYYLNCAAVRQIPAHGSVTYAMELPLPASLPPGTYAKLDWQIQGGTGPAAVAPVTVLPMREGPAGPLAAPGSIPAPPPAGTGVPVAADCPAALYGPQAYAPGAAKTVALTFDDGPGKSTAAILAILARYRVPATFFNIGANMAARPWLVRDEARDGYVLGDHTWDHPDLAALSAARQAAELDLVSAEQRSLTGTVPCVFRPPYGDYDGTTLALASQRRMGVWLWSADTQDWMARRSSSPWWVQRIISLAERGGSLLHPIVLMHNQAAGNPATVGALPAIIQFFRSNGYRFVAL